MFNYKYLNWRIKFLLVENLTFKQPNLLKCYYFHIKKHYLTENF